MAPNEEQLATAIHEQQKFISENAGHPLSQVFFNSAELVENIVDQNKEISANQLKAELMKELKEKGNSFSTLTFRFGDSFQVNDVFQNSINGSLLVDDMYEVSNHFLASTLDKPFLREDENERLNQLYKMIKKAKWGTDVKQIKLLSCVAGLTAPYLAKARHFQPINSEDLFSVKNYGVDAEFFKDKEKFDQLLSLVDTDQK